MFLNESNLEKKTEEWWLPGIERRGNGELLFISYEVSGENDEEFLGISCTTAR